MSKTYLGVDIGYDNVKLALVAGGRVKKLASAELPVNLIKEGRITSADTLGELIRAAMKDAHISASGAALVLSDEVTFVRTTSMPVLSADQLAYNIPYEFADYVTEELKNYVFDYITIKTPAPASPAAQEQEEDDGGEKMELMAAAVSSSVLQENREMLRKAGLKLAKAAPVCYAYISLIRAAMAAGGQDLPEVFCILDLGFRGIRMYIFQGDRHVVTRELEIGLSSLDDVIADALGVDAHLAHTYLLSNFEDCQNQEYCLNAYGNVAVELMRSLNFYRYSSPDSQITDVWLCGGGAKIRPLRQAVADALDTNVHLLSELIAPGDEAEELSSYIQAIGLALD